MSDRVRLDLQVSPAFMDVLETIAVDSHTSKEEVIRQAVALMQVAHSARQDGKHVGIVADPGKLDTELKGLL